MHIAPTGRIALGSSLVLMAMAATLHAGAVELVSATGTLTATAQPAAGAPITSNFDITYETVGDDSVDATDNNGNQAGLSFRHEGIGPSNPGDDFPLLLTSSYILAHAAGGSAAVTGSITILTDRQLDYEVSIVSFDGDRILTATLDGNAVTATPSDPQPHHDGPLTPGTHVWTFSGATRTDIDTPPFASGDFQLGLFPAGDVVPPSAIPLPAGVYPGLAVLGLLAWRLRQSGARAV